MAIMALRVEDDLERTKANIAARAAIGLDDALTKWQLYGSEAS